PSSLKLLKKCCEIGLRSPIAFVPPHRYGNPPHLHASHGATPEAATLIELSCRWSRTRHLLNDNYVWCAKAMDSGRFHVLCLRFLRGQPLSFKRSPSY